MKNKKEFGDSLLYTIPNYLWWFIAGSFYFLILNIPLILTAFAFLYEPRSRSALILLLSCIPVGPALTALLSVMGRLIRTQGVNMTKDFFKAYKTNFLQSLFVWMVELIIFFILYIDIKYFAVKLPVLKYFFITAAALIFIVSLHIYPIISRFYMRTRDVIKLSIYHSVKNFKVTFINLMLVIIYALVVVEFPYLVLMLMISAVSFGIMYFEKNILNEIENKLQTDSSTSLE